MALEVLNGPVIEAGESLSEGIDLSGGKLVRVTMPAAWTSPNQLTFQISSDGEFYNDLVDNAGNPVEWRVTPGSAVVVEASLAVLAAAKFVKLRAGTPKNPVPQDERREFAVAIETPDAA